jgi:hypothetical protein
MSQSIARSAQPLASLRHHPIEGSPPHATTIPDFQNFKNSGSDTDRWPSSSNDNIAHDASQETLVDRSQPRSSGMGGLDSLRRILSGSWYRRRYTLLVLCFLNAMISYAGKIIVISLFIIQDIL